MPWRLLGQAGGYFRSLNAKREVDAARANALPLRIVYETETDHGGGTLLELNVAGQ